MKTQKILIALLSIFILTFSSCGNISDNPKESQELNPGMINDRASLDFTGNENPSPLTAETKQVTSKNFTVLNRDRMIIKTGILNLEIENYTESEKEISGIIKNLNGYIAKSGSNFNAAGKVQGKMDIRIPAKDFDVLISEISKTGKVKSMNTNSRDITEDYIDTEARAKTQKTLEERLISLLNEKTAKLSDIVEVEQKLADVRAQIESMEGRLRYLKNQTDYSTLTVNLSEPSLLQTSSGGGFFYEMLSAFKKGLQGFTGVIAGLITFIVSVSPVLILLLIIVILVRKYFIRRKLKPESINIQTN